MYDQIREDTLFAMFYGGVTFMAMIASCYLLFRRANAIAPDVTPPARLRRWTGLYFASIALTHVWYLPLFFKTSCDDILMTDLIGGVLDSITVIPISIVILFAMLQDHQRPLWPIAVMTAPISLGMAACVATRSDALYPVIYAYVLLMSIGLITYMVCATRKYSRWLRDNYADLEHKEVWQSFIVLAILLIMYVVYEFTNDGLVYMYAMQVICVVLICYLLWRVETLSDLNIQLAPAEAEVGSCQSPATDGKHQLADDKQQLSEDIPQLTKDIPQNTLDDIGKLLQQHCVDTQFYLQHDLNISQLSRAIGTNRYYLSQYFSSQGITYNAYINDLRINHFITLYREAVAAKRPFTALQLANESGYRSYSTFSLAFQQRMGQNVRTWMNSINLNP